MKDMTICGIAVKELEMKSVCCSQSIFREGDAVPLGGGELSLNRFIKYFLM